MRRRRVVVSTFATLLVAAGVVWIASRGSKYPTTLEGWAARREAALAEFGRTPGENWAVWVEVFEELESAPQDLEHQAAVLDRLVPCAVFTQPVSPTALAGTSKSYGGYSPRAKLRRVLEPGLRSALDRGDLNEAARWIERAWALTRVAASEGGVIGALGQQAFVLMALEVCRPSLPAIAAEDGDRFNQLFSSAPLPDFAWSMRLERENILAFIWGKPKQRWPPQARDQSMIAERLIDAMLDSQLDDDPDALAEVRDTIARFDQDTLYTRRRSAIALATPAYDRFLSIWRESESECHSALLMLALERHRVMHGAYPQTLSELVPAFLESIPPDDSASDRAYRYRPLDPKASTMEAGYILYSVGADRVDDGGKMSPERPGEELRIPGGDRVFNLPIPKFVPITQPEPFVQDEIEP